MSWNFPGVFEGVVEYNYIEDYTALGKESEYNA